jgi:hypothetical protein
MRIKTAFDTIIDYKDFATPFSGLATMIFVQAANDYMMLGNDESAILEACAISKTEISNFMCSPWAKFLGACLGWDEDEMQFKGVNQTE